MKTAPLSLVVAVTVATSVLSGDTNAAEIAVITASASDRVAARPELVITTLGFGSCAKQQRPQPIWDAIHAARCDAFVLCGDNIYGDSADPLVLREKYALLAAMPGFAKLRQTTPLFGTWDNHDYGSDEVGAGWEGAAAAQQEFCNFFQYPANAPQRSSTGIHDCITLGPLGKRVQLILLDSKSFRSPLKEADEPSIGYVPNTDPGVTILGEEQWAWLERRLREPAEVRVLVSSNQLIPSEHHSQKWANFPADRSRFFKLLQATRAKGLVIVSGDRHLAEISCLPEADGVPYPLYEMTTSALNQPGTHTMSKKSEANRYRTHPNTYIGSNFGILRINWDTPQPSLRFQVCDLDGTPVITQGIPPSKITTHLATPVPVATAKSTTPPAAASDRVAARPELTINTLGFGSCARQERPQPIWESIHAARCDAFVLCGDNIYGDSPDPLVLREKYSMLDAMPGFAKLRQTTPLFATWDDHDYGINDGGAGFPGAAAAQKEFCDFFQVPATSPLRSTSGIYDCVNFGPEEKRVQLILLDTRSFRSPLKKDSANPKVNIPNTDPTATILGDEQWAWLERRLREPAQVRAVVSSISFISTEHGSEKWANFPQERARFLELLRRTEAKGVVLISGDRHLAELSLLKPDDGAPYPLYDMTTSGLNQPVAKESEYTSESPPKGPANRYRIHERPYTGSNFGLMRFKWDDPNPSTRLEVCGLGGQLIFSQDIPIESKPVHNP